MSADTVTRTHRLTTSARARGIPAGAASAGGALASLGGRVGALPLSRSVRPAARTVHPADLARSTPRGRRCGRRARPTGSGTACHGTRPVLPRRLRGRAPSRPAGRRAGGPRGRYVARPAGRVDRRLAGRGRDEDRRGLVGHSRAPAGASIIILLGFGTTNAAIAVGITSVATFARLSRSEVTLRAAPTTWRRRSGPGDVRGRPQGRHILPNSSPPSSPWRRYSSGPQDIAISTLGFQVLQWC